MEERRSSVRLPEREDVEIILVQLPDGTIVARTRQELEKAAGNPAHRGGET